MSDAPSMKVQDWRTVVIECAAALGRESGTFYLDLPEHVRALRNDKAALKQRVRELEGAEAEREKWHAKSRRLEAENAELRRLIARAYRAYYKDAWAEGETWNEVAADLHWHGIGILEADAALHAEGEVKEAGGE